jgi:hypothetical protein
MGIVLLKREFRRNSGQHRSVVEHLCALAQISLSGTETRMKKNPYFPPCRRNPDQLRTRIIAFNAVARHTQQTYGTRSAAAGLEILQNRTIVVIMRARSTRIVISPFWGDCMPKKANDQRVLTASWAENIAAPCRTALFSSPFCSIRYREIPISMYSAVQTGPNTQSGGVKNGFWSRAYHVVIAGMVTNEPIMPASRGNAIQRIRSPAERREDLSIRDQKERLKSQGLNLPVDGTKDGV